ncbi:uncharacterized protein J3D65DRAFT_286147 [Phyllosticta citribraziliensis]|uniref:Uncharacterized protein n=1 Tax=Phyllosticta citribraziliensis TaxID=989973 RepID=A0ABR1LWS1_9PEZI
MSSWYPPNQLNNGRQMAPLQPTQMRMPSHCALPAPSLTPMQAPTGFKALNAKTSSLGLKPLCLATPTLLRARWTPPRLRARSTPPRLRTRSTPPRLRACSTPPKLRARSTPPGLRASSTPPQRHATCMPTLSITIISSSPCTSSSNMRSPSVPSATPVAPSARLLVPSVTLLALSVSPLVSFTLLGSSALHRPLRSTRPPRLPPSTSPMLPLPLLLSTLRLPLPLPQATSAATSSSAAAATER